MGFSFEKNKLLVILALGLALRLFLIGAVLFQGNASLLYDGDTGSYKALAYAIVKGDFLFTEDHAKQMTLIRTPGYPLFLGIGYALGLNDFAIAFLQVLLDTVVIYLMFRLGNLVGNAGWQAALFYAISPLFISFSFKLLTEGFFIFVFIIANLLFFMNLENKEDGANKKFAMLGLLFGFLILIRPVVIAFPIFYAALYYWHKRRWKGLALMLVIAYAIAGLWVLRNFFVLDEISFSHVGALGYVCWTGPLIANDDRIDITPWQKEYDEFGLSSPADCTEKVFKRPEVGIPTVTNIIFAHPFVYLHHTLNAAVLLFSPQTPGYIMDVFGQERPELSFVLFEHGLDIARIWSEVSKNIIYFLLLILFLAYQVGLYFLFTLGIWKNVKHAKLLLALTGVMLVYIIIVQGPQILFSGYRYRMPVEPLLILGAAMGLNSIQGVKKKWKKYQ